MMRLIPIVPCLFLAACMNHTSIQRGYISERDRCQGEAETRMDALLRYQQAEEPDARSVNAQLVRLFSDCMVDYGWSVATPVREEDLAAGPGLEAPGSPLPAARVAQQGGVNAPVYYAQGAQPGYPVAAQSLEAPAAALPAARMAPGAVAAHAAPSATPVAAPVFYSSGNVRGQQQQAVMPQQQQAQGYYVYYPPVQQQRVQPQAARPAMIQQQRAAQPTPAPTYFGPSGLSTSLRPGQYNTQAAPADPSVYGLRMPQAAGQ